MRVVPALTIALTLLFSLVASGCGNTDTRTTLESKETQGQQLLDLKEALDKGAINQEEYDEAKEEILEGE